MKKVLFAMAVAMAIGVVQGAQVAWSIGGVMAPNLDGTASSTTLAKSSANFTKELTLLFTGTSGSVADVNDNGGTQSWTTKSSGNVSGATATSYDLGTTVDYTATIVATGLAGTDYEGYEYTWTSSGSFDITKAQGQEPLALTFSGPWTITAEPTPPTPGPSGDIPEPTSGLLMLVGLGALALRRRR